MSVRSDILQTLAASPNLAAERALEAALSEALGPEQTQLADILMERNRRAGWVALIRHYHKLDRAIQEKILARPRDLFSPLAEAMHEGQGPVRENVIAIVQSCTEVRLVYLLAEALMDTRPEVRTQAGNSLLEAVRRHWQSRHGGDSASSASSEDAIQLRKAVELGLRQFKIHRQNTALLAALIHERQLDSWLWPLFDDTYDERTRAATVILRAPNEPALATAILVALGSNLKSAAMAGLGTLEAPALAEAIAAESFRLLDPQLRERQCVGHLKMLPALRKNPPWRLDNWSAWLRLMESVGLQPMERLTWLTQLANAAPPGPEACAWKISVARALAETGLSEAAVPLAMLARDPEERVARCAGRFLLSRRHAEWRESAVQALSQSPHASVRRLLNLNRQQREARKPEVITRATVTKTPERTQQELSKPPYIPPTRTVALDPVLAEQIRGKLQGSLPEVAEGLKLIATLPNPTPYRNQIIALCGNANGRIVAQAIGLIGRLEDPRARELLEAATHHADARVRANAVEAMVQLHIADRSPHVRALLQSRHNRERANAILALGQSNFDAAREQLQRMLEDANPLHRMSALWVVSQLRLLDAIRQISIMAQGDSNLRVRKRAADMLAGTSVAQPEVV